MYHQSAQLLTFCTVWEYFMHIQPWSGPSSYDNKQCQCHATINTALHVPNSPRPAE